MLKTVYKQVQPNPTKSLRRLSAQTGLSYGSCHRAVRKLHLHPYKVSVVQQLLPLDFRKCVHNWFNENFNNDEILDVTFFSDEAWCHLTGYVNSQNYRSSNTENPHIFHETVLHSIKLGVWVTMSRRRIIEPYFFHENVTG